MSKLSMALQLLHLKLSADFQLRLLLAAQHYIMLLQHQGHWL